MRLGYAVNMEILMSVKCLPNNPELPERYKKQAIDTAYALLENKKCCGNLRCNHFSFVFLNNRLVSIGRNVRKTHPINRRNPKFNMAGEKIDDSKYSCSELVALLKIKKIRNNFNFNKSILVNVRIDRRGEISFAKPCQSCLSLLKFLNIKKVFFTDYTGEFKYYENEKI